MQELTQYKYTQLCRRRSCNVGFLDKSAGHVKGHRGDGDAMALAEPARIQ